jgi:hypothetical protein
VEDSLTQHFGSIFERLKVLKPNIIKVVLGEEQRTIDKHLLVEVLEIFHIGETQADQT